MERDTVQRYVASLEQVVRSTHLDLRGTMIQFQEYSQRLTTDRAVPLGGHHGYSKNLYGNS